MREENFERFTIDIEHLGKCIRALEIAGTAQFGIKAVHAFWIYSLIIHPEGLTATEIAATRHINRSLVSREIDRLHKEDIIESDEQQNGRKSKYNRRIRLTEKGRQVARRIVSIATDIQKRVDEGIDAGELEVFYSVLERLCDNFTKLMGENNKKRSSYEKYDYNRLNLHSGCCARECD